MEISSIDCCRQKPLRLFLIHFYFLVLAYFTRNRGLCYGNVFGFSLLQVHCRSVASQFYRICLIRSAVLLRWQGESEKASGTEVALLSIKFSFYFIGTYVTKQNQVSPISDNLFSLQDSLM